MRQHREPLRKGKWTIEEEEYTAGIINHFTKGLLKLPEGTTLRAYLAEKLNCDPMRITKKFTGGSCLGKRVYHPPDDPSITPEELERARRELEQLESRFQMRLERNKDRTASLIDFDSRFFSRAAVVSTPGIDAMLFGQPQPVSSSVMLAPQPPLAPPPPGPPAGLNLYGGPAWGPAGEQQRPWEGTHLPSSYLKGESSGVLPALSEPRCVHPPGYHPSSCMCRSGSSGRLSAYDSATPSLGHPPHPPTYPPPLGHVGGAPAAGRDSSHWSSSSEDNEEGRTAKIRRREDARAQADVTDDDWQHHEVEEEEGVDEEERLAGMTFGRMARERRGVVEEKSAVKDDEADEDEDDKDAGALMMGLVDSIHRSGSHHDLANWVVGVAQKTAHLEKENEVRKQQKKHNGLRRGV